MILRMLQKCCASAARFVPKLGPPTQQSVILKSDQPAETTGEGCALKFPRLVSAAVLSPKAERARLLVLFSWQS